METNTYAHQNTCIKILIAFKTVTAPNWKELKYLPIVNKNKPWYIYTMEYYTAMKK